LRESFSPNRPVFVLPTRIDGASSARIAAEGWPGSTEPCGLPAAGFVAVETRRTTNPKESSMSSIKKGASKKPNIAIQQAFPKERGVFKALLLTNPNYFGNLAKSPFDPILPIQQSTFYEELGCLGYQPQQERLEAVVYVYQPTGYGTGICGAGTPEFVRFICPTTAAPPGRTRA
jgi:hypothetical protein